MLARDCPFAPSAHRSLRITVGIVPAWRSVGHISAAGQPTTNCIVGVSVCASLLVRLTSLRRHGEQLPMSGIICRAPWDVKPIFVRVASAPWGFSGPVQQRLLPALGSAAAPRGHAPADPSRRGGTAPERDMSVDLEAWFLCEDLTTVGFSPSLLPKVSPCPETRPWYDSAPFPMRSTATWYRQLLK
jgi:hypothetical protein